MKDEKNKKIKNVFIKIINIISYVFSSLFLILLIISCVKSCDPNYKSNVKQAYSRYNSQVFGIYTAKFNLEDGTGLSSCMSDILDYVGDDDNLDVSGLYDGVIYSVNQNRYYTISDFEYYLTSEGDGNSNYYCDFGLTYSHMSFQGNQYVKQVSNVEISFIYRDKYLEVYNYDSNVDENGEVSFYFASQDKNIYDPFEVDTQNAGVIFKCLFGGDYVGSTNLQYFDLNNFTQAMGVDNFMGLGVYNNVFGGSDYCIYEGVLRYNNQFYSQIYVEFKSFGGLNETFYYYEYDASNNSVSIRHVNDQYILPVAVYLRRTIYDGYSTKIAKQYIYRITYVSGGMYIAPYSDLRGSLVNSNEYMLYVYVNGSQAFNLSFGLTPNDFSFDYDNPYVNVFNMYRDGLQALTSLFTIQILPFMTLGTLLFMPLAVGIVLVIIKLVTK